jgi:hypothetical protein
MESNFTDLRVCDGQFYGIRASWLEDIPALAGHSTYAAPAPKSQYENLQNI